MKAYLFPGQGSQRTGMGEKLFDAFAEITTAADAILGYSIKELCLKDARRQLGQTQYTQPALYVVNALTHRQRSRDTGERPDFAAGHSLGEYNALECAGAFGFEDGLRLVKKRGELMSAAPRGAMAAILGLPADRVAGILSDSGLGAIDVANYNAATQTIISGLEQDIRNAQKPFEDQGAMYIPLNAGGAFHSRYMKPVVEEFAAFLQDFQLTAPKIPVIANIDALPYRPDSIARNLLDQLANPVRWQDSVTYLLQQGVTEFPELGPGDVLTKLMRGIKSQFKPTAPQPAPSKVVTPAPPPSASPQQRVADWNRAHPVGTNVRAKGYEQTLTTKSQAVVLFGHRAAVYMQGYNGYFALDEVEPIIQVARVA